MISENPWGKAAIQLKAHSVTKVTLISTGGTIEKVYDESNGEMKNCGPQIEKNLSKLLRLPYCDLEFVSLMSKDSLLMDEQDRSTIVECLQEHQANGNPIIVLHGTDTMEHTVQFCAQHMAQPRVPIVFTGSMKPYGFQDSDAMQNVCEALLAAKFVSAGLYVVFHNHIFDATRVTKNRDKMTFEYL